jgi:hypothetical protein
MSIPAWYLDETRYKYSYEDVTGTREEPKTALKKFGPYSKDKFRTTRIGVAMLSSTVHRQTGEKFYKAFQEGLSAYYKPFGSIYNLESCYYHPIKVFSGTDAASYRTAALELVREIESIEIDLWLCFLLIEDRFRQLSVRHNPYFAGRAVLLSNKVLVQGITVEKASKRDWNLQWILDSIAVQSYAKLGGTPWAIATGRSEAEIIIGIGEARVSGSPTDERFFGFATVFNQNGAYLWTRFGQPVVGFDNYLISLQDRVKQSIKDYTETEKVVPERLIIHLYKPPGKRTEARAIETALAELGSDIECAIIHIDHRTDFRVFDSGAEDLKPKGRLVTYVDDYQRLIVLSGSEVEWIPPRVARVRLSPRSTYRDLNGLTQQVYDFTNVHWAGLQPNNVPVTIKYPSQLARMYASLGQFDEDWYGLITAGFLSDKVWFI